MRLNRSLVSGPDFGGVEPGGRYLRAVDRYAGRFYQALGDVGRARLLGCRCHVLIVSPLYGLLLPAEPVQLYSCPVDSGLTSAANWTGPKSGPTLTDLLRSYIRRYRIARVLDFLPNLGFRGLVDWDDLARSPSLGLTGVLHYLTDTGAGDDALQPAAAVLRELLLDRDDLLALRADSVHTLASQHFLLATTLDPPRG